MPEINPRIRRAIDVVLYLALCVMVLLGWSVA